MPEKNRSIAPKRIYISLAEPATWTAVKPEGDHIEYVRTPEEDEFMAALDLAVVTYYDLQIALQFANGRDNRAVKNTQRLHDNAINALKRMLFDE